MLREDNNRLRNENHAMKTKLSRPICSNCGGPTIFNNNSVSSVEEQQLRLENARMKDELSRMVTLANKLLGKPTSSLGHSVVSLPPSNTLDDLATIGSHGVLPSEFNFQHGTQPIMSLPKPNIDSTLHDNITETSHGKSGYVDLALWALSELMRMAEAESPLWTRSSDGARDVLNHDEYRRMHSYWMGPTRSGYVSEATRETGMVLIDSLAIVETLMDMVRRTL